MSPEPEASIWALSFGQSILGAISTSSLSPKFFIARAAAPTFSPIWGWESMTAGGVIWRFDGPVFVRYFRPAISPPAPKFEDFHGQDQGRQPRRRAGRRRDDAHHLGPDQEEAGPALSGHRPALLRPVHPAPRRDRRQDHGRGRRGDQEIWRGREMRHHHPG